MPESPLAPEVPEATDLQVFYLWPENVQAWQLFQACATQWRVGLAGREGLDYAGVQVVMDHHVRPRKHRQRFRELQVMESAALEEWALSHAREQKQNK